jgi:hypothetical protein
VTNLKMFLYKVLVVQQLLPPDFEKWRHHCEWLPRKLDNDPYIQDWTFFSDKA